MSPWPGEDNVVPPLPRKWQGSPVQGKIINSVASVFILTAKTLVIAKFMILAKVKLRCESNRRWLAARITRFVNPFAKWCVWFSNCQDLHEVLGGSRNGKTRVLEWLKCSFGRIAFSPQMSFLFPRGTSIFVFSRDTRRHGARRLSGVLVSQKGKYDQKDQEDIDDTSFLKVFACGVTQIKIGLVKSVFIFLMCWSKMIQGKVFEVLFAMRLMSHWMCLFVLLLLLFFFVVREFSTYKLCRLAQIWVLSWLLGICAYRRIIFLKFRIAPANWVFEACHKPLIFDRVSFTNAQTKVTTPRWTKGTL